MIKQRDIYARRTVAKRREHGLRPDRAGLAPLELILSLPLLLAVMALIVNFGHASIWKTRSATAARLSMWRHRPLWHADGDPRPENYFPDTASMRVQSGPRVAAADAVWNDPMIAQPWIKGPVFVAENGYLQVRDNRVNEMSEGVTEGKAGVTLRYPFLPSMGNLSMSADHTLLDSLWQFHSMGYGWNEARRAKNWWNIENSSDWMLEQRRFMEVDQDLRQNPMAENLRPLDRDLGLIEKGFQFDFYPRLTPDCSGDLRQVWENLTAPGGHLDAITGSRESQTTGVAEEMAQSYLNWCRAELAIAESQPGMGGRVSLLKLWIEQLTRFLETLRKSPLSA